MRNQIASFLLALFSAFAFSTAPLMAVVIPPIGLAPGQQYQLVFVTEHARDATSGNRADYNAFVTAEASLSTSLPSTTWKAIVSDAPIPIGTGTSAKVNAPSGGLPVYNTQGLEVSPNGIYSISSLPFQKLINPILTDQNGSQVFSVGYPVWSGSNSNGNSYPGLYLGPQLGAVYGVLGEINARWLTANAGSTTSAFPFYALSDILIVPVPEPTTLTLLGSALLVFGGIRCLRWRKARPKAAHGGTH